MRYETYLVNKLAKHVLGKSIPSGFSTLFNTLKIVIWCKEVLEILEVEYTKTHEYNGAYALHLSAHDQSS